MTQRNIPIIDLANTFDQKDAKFYRDVWAPSLYGGKIIAKLVQYVVNHHNYDKSYGYALNDGIVKMYDILSKWNMTPIFIWRWLKTILKTEIFTWHWAETILKSRHILLSLVRNNIKSQYILLILVRNNIKTRDVLL